MNIKVNHFINSRLFFYFTLKLNVQIYYVLNYRIISLIKSNPFCLFSSQLVDSVKFSHLIYRNSGDQITGHVRLYDRITKKPHYIKMLKF